MMDIAKKDRYLILFFLIFVGVFFLICNFKFSLTLGPDFRSYYNAVWANRMDLNIYDIDNLNLVARSKSNGLVFPYLYPPLLTVFMYPLSRLSVENANYIWNLLSFVLLIVIFYLSTKIALFSLQDQEPQREVGVHDIFFVVTISLLIFFLLPFELNFWKGQVNIIVLTFMVLSLYFLFCKPKYYLSGFLLSIAFLIKVTPAILLLIMIKKEKRKCLYGFAGGACSLFLLSVAVNGIGSWKDFVNFLPHTSFGQTPPGLFHPKSIYNFSIAGFFSRLSENNPNLVSWLTTISIVVLIGIACFVFYKKKNMQLLMVPLFSIIMVIAAPYTYLHHCIFLFPGFVLLFSKIYLKLETTEKYFYSSILFFLLYIVGTDCSMFYQNNKSGLFLKIGTYMNLYGLLIMFTLILIFSLKVTDNAKEVFFSQKEDPKLK